MDRINALFKHDLIVKAENYNQEKEFRRMIKSSGLRVPLRDAYGYDKKGQRIFPIYYQLTMYQNKPCVMWHTHWEEAFAVMHSAKDCALCVPVKMLKKMLLCVEYAKEENLSKIS